MTSFGVRNFVFSFGTMSILCQLDYNSDSAVDLTGQDLACILDRHEVNIKYCPIRSSQNRVLIQLTLFKVALGDQNTNDNYCFKRIAASGLHA